MKKIVTYCMYWYCIILFIILFIKPRMMLLITLTVKPFQRTQCVDTVSVTWANNKSKLVPCFMSDRVHGFHIVIELTWIEWNVKKVPNWVDYFQKKPLGIILGGVLLITFKVIHPSVKDNQMEYNFPLTLWLPGRGACQDPDILV